MRFVQLKDYIEARALEIGEYIVENDATVRQAARHFRVSKSTVHMDVSKRLNYVMPSLAARVRLVLDKNKEERHIRGGLATRDKYLLKK